MKKSFYSAALLAALRRKNRIWNTVFAALCAVAAGLIVFFCVRTNTLNAPRMEFCATLSFVAAGWLGITIRGVVLRYDRALYTHVERILAAQEEERRVVCRAAVEKKCAVIPRSIDVRRVRIETADGVERAYVNESFAAELEKAADGEGKTTLFLTEGFVTGVER